MQNKLKQVLDDKGISQKELAYMTGYTEPTISNYIKGKRRGSVVAWAIIADAIGCSIDDLIDLKEV